MKNNIIKLLERDYDNNLIIEPNNRYELIKPRLIDIIKSYNPETIIKIGAGNKLYLDLMLENSQSIIVVVDQSYNNLNKLKDDEKYEKYKGRLYFVVSDYENFVIDYYKADLIVCIDQFDLFNTSKVVDEFKRALQFNSILFICLYCLPNEDVEGIFDELAHLINPLHNDYYLINDLETFFKIKEFDIVKMHLKEVEYDILKEYNKYIEYINYNSNENQIKNFIDENLETFKNIYKFDKGVIKLPYVITAFKRRKPVQED